MQADWAWGEPPSLVWQRTREQAGGPKSNASSPNIRRGPKLGGQVPQRPTTDPTHAGPPSARRLWSVAPVLPKLVCIGPPGGGGGGVKMGHAGPSETAPKRPETVPHPLGHAPPPLAGACPVGPCIAYRSEGAEGVFRAVGRPFGAFRGPRGAVWGGSATPRPRAGLCAARHQEFGRISGQGARSAIPKALS